VHAFDIKFQDLDEKQSYPYLTSWGTTTRLIGALVMTHGDQKGLVLPPQIAPIQVVIIPIFKSGYDNATIIAVAKNLCDELKKQDIRVFIDDEESQTPGSKFFKWELKGVPVRIELGPKDIENKQAVVVDRIGLGKRFIPLSELVGQIAELLITIQKKLFTVAQEKVQSMLRKGDTLVEFGPLLENDGIFYQAGWCKDAACEEQLKQYKASIRCIRQTHECATCFHCGRNSTDDVLVARSY
jgi:prolyl-tRNA synthetase